MYNFLLAKVEDHVSGARKDDDVELALYEIERAGFDRKDVVRRVVTNRRIDSRILAMFDRRLGDIDAKVAAQFPAHIRPHVESMLKAYYLRREE